MRRGVFRYSLVWVEVGTWRMETEGFFFVLLCVDAVVGRSEKVYIASGL
jgi:hypothetical protein